MLLSIGLLIISNVFMTIAWYGHLKGHQSKPLIYVILISWLIAFVEYCFQVPANRMGHQYFTLGQLKVMQEIISMAVFFLFAIFYMKNPLEKNFIYASICLVMAAFFMFKSPT